MRRARAPRAQAPSVRKMSARPRSRCGDAYTADGEVGRPGAARDIRARTSENFVTCDG